MVVSVAKQRPEENIDVGGHEAVKDEVVEDLALAQLVVRRGLKLELRMAEGDLSTRMYRSLADMVRGWSKNLVMGGLQTISPRLRPFVPPASLLAVTELSIASALDVDRRSGGTGWARPRSCGRSS